MTSLRPIIGLLFAVSARAASAAPPINAYEALTNQLPTAVQSVATDNAFTEATEHLWLAALAGDLNQPQLPHYRFYSPFFLGNDPAGLLQMSTIQWNEAHGTNPGQVANGEQSRFTTLSATPFQFQTIPNDQFPFAPQVVMADLATFRHFEGSSALKDKLTNKTAWLIQNPDSGAPLQYALYALYTYSGFKSSWDGRPETRLKLSKKFSLVISGWSWQAAGFADGLEDRKTVPAGSLGGNPDSEQWSAGGIGSIIGPSDAVLGAWRLDETFAALRSNAESVTQSFGGWQATTALKAPKWAFLLRGAPSASLEYDSSDYDRGLTSAFSAKQTLVVKVDWTFVANSKHPPPKTTFTIGATRVHQGVTNSDSNRKLSPFHDAEFYVALSIANSDTSFVASPIPLRLKQLVQ